MAPSTGAGTCARTRRGHSPSIVSRETVGSARIVAAAGSAVTGNSAASCRDSFLAVNRCASCVTKRPEGNEEWGPSHAKQPPRSGLSPQEASPIVEEAAVDGGPHSRANREHLVGAHGVAAVSRETAIRIGLGLRETPSTHENSARDRVDRTMENYERADRPGNARGSSDCFT